MDAEQPAWMNGPPSSQAPGGAAAAPPPSNYGSTSSTAPNAKMVRLAVRVLVMGMCVMMAAAGVLALSQITDSDNEVTDAIVSLYVVLFAAILFFHEVNEVYRMERLESILAKNFGFLFKPIGKGCFIVFIAFLNFGLSNTNNLGLATGVCLCIVGFGYILLYLKNPDYFENDIKPNQVAQYSRASTNGP